jgi:hypothetical protein
MNDMTPITGTHEEPYDHEAASSASVRAETDHMRNFNQAIRNALEEWPYDGDVPAKLTFHVKIRKVNPGWILSYGATFTPNP